MANLEGFWAFQVPNLILAMLMYTLLGRFLLSLIFPPDSDKVIWRVFQQITDPVVKSVAFVTPQIVPERILVLFAVVWMILLRVLLFFTMRSYGLVPPIA